MASYILQLMYTLQWLSYT